MIVDHKILDSWSPPSHLYGSCFVLEQSNLAYINIPKNASTWVKSQLLTLDCYEYNYFKNLELAKMPKLVILRDPIERWISGISWYMTMYHGKLFDKCKDDFSQSILMEIITNKINFDEHTTPQMQFLQAVDFDNTTFIKVNHTDRVFCKVFSKFFKCELGIDNSFDQEKPQHVAKFKAGQNRWVNFFQSVLDQNLINKLNQYYQDDIRLFNKVKFYE